MCRIRHQSGIILICLVLIIGVGCSRSTTVTGIVLNDGKPYVLGKSGSILITFIPHVEQHKEYTSIPVRVKKDGTFSVSNVPPGKYKIAVEHFFPNPQTDLLGGRFSPKRTKIILDIPDACPLKIEVGQTAK